MKELTEQGTISPVPLKKLAKVYFVRAENDVVSEEGWITVDEARRKNAQDRRAFGATVNKYFEDADSAEQYTTSLRGPELPEEPGALGPEPEPGLGPEPEGPPGLGEEPDLEVPDFGLEDEPGPELGMGEEPGLGPDLGPELGPPELEPEEDEVLEIEVPRKIRLKPTKKSIPGLPGESLESFDELVELQEQGIHTEYQPGSQVQTRGGKVLEIVRDMTNGDPFATKRYLVRDENNQEFEVLANQITPAPEAGPEDTTKASFWNRMLGRSRMTPSVPQGAQTRFPALGGESMHEAAPKCPYCDATDIQDGICQNCRRKVEKLERNTEQEDEDSESTPDGVIAAVLAGDVNGAAAVEALYDLDKKD